MPDPRISDPACPLCGQRGPLHALECLPLHVCGGCRDDVHGMLDAGLDPAALLEAPTLALAGHALSLGALPTRDALEADWVPRAAPGDLRPTLPARPLAVVR